MHWFFRGVWGSEKECIIQELQIILGSYIQVSISIISIETYEWQVHGANCWLYYLSIVATPFITKGHADFQSVEPIGLHSRMIDFGNWWSIISDYTDNWDADFCSF